LCDRCLKVFAAAVAIIIAIVVVVVVVVLAVMLSVDDGGGNCQNSNFTSLPVQGQSALKYMFVTRTPKRQYNFVDAKKACEDQGATLWEVLGGRDEWEAVIEMAKREEKTNLWLNGKTPSRCAGQSCFLRTKYFQKMT
jgi:hypothetical protein